MVQVRLIYPLAGKPLRIGKHTICLGIPEIYLLEPAEKLRSHIVIKSECTNCYGML